jgi:hypothetical protein
MLLVALVIAVIVILQVTSGHDANVVGYNVGYFGAAPLISGLIVGIWAKLAKSRWTWFAYVWRFVLGSVLIFGFALFGDTVQNSVALAKFTDAEKQHLTLDGSAARHSDFGFTVPLPSADFVFNADLQKQANQEFEQRGIGAANYAWVLSEPKRREAVILIVTKGVGNNEAALRGLGHGMNTSAGKAGGAVIEDTMEWSPAAHEYRFATTQQDMYVRARCVASMTTGPSSYILCVETVSADPNGLDQTRSGMTLASWN